ncbi:MAG: nucleotidyltransferase domain-containing protein [Planctomycetota bacterium]
MEDVIQSELLRIEAGEDVRILFAIESGSRAWGFPSRDSDYDVRFVYARRPDGYLSVFEGRDVIELPISGLLDINGWDLKKSYGLMRKSNPPLMEWLLSPIVYRRHAATDNFHEQANEAFRPLAACHHYHSMMRNMMSAIGNGEQVRMKKYLYSLRPMLAAQWVQERGTQPPILFQDLVEAYMPAGPLRTFLDAMIERKASDEETGLIERHPPLDQFLEEGFRKLGESLPEATSGVPPERVNAWFRAMLQEVWQ